MLIEADRPSPWPVFATNVAALWAFFMLPMTVTALTVLVAQLEHGPKFWNHLLALPIARWRLYAAKAAVVALLTGATSASLLLLIPAAGYVAEALASGTQLTGSFDPVASARFAWQDVRRLAASDRDPALGGVSLQELRAAARARHRRHLRRGRRDGREARRLFPLDHPDQRLVVRPRAPRSPSASASGAGWSCWLLMLVAMSRREMA